jgi:DNA polymerase-3 subunit beta
VYTVKARITNLSAFRDALSFSDVAKGTMEILECALIEAQNNMLTVTFSDLCIWLVAEVPAEVEEEGAVAIKARLLEGFVRGVKEPVVIKTHKDTVVVSSGEAELKLAPYSAEDFPRDIEAETICTVTIRADVLKQALKKLLFIPSKDELQPARSSVYLHVVDGELRAVATDGVRLGIVPVMKMRFSGPLSPAVIESREYTYVLMPMRLPSEERNNGRSL